MSHPTSIEAWLRKKGFLCETVEDMAPGNAVLTLAGCRSQEWSKALVQKSGLLVLRPTSPTDPLMTGLLFTSLNTDEPRATAEALNHLMVVQSTSILMKGIMDHPAGCLIQGLGTARAAFSSLR